MGYLWFLAVQSWKKRTAGYLYVILGTLVSTAFLAGFLGLAVSLHGMYYKDACQNYGSYDVKIAGGDEDAFWALKNMDGAVQAGSLCRAGMYTLGDYTLEGTAYDADALSMEALRLQAGSLPKDSSEIAVSRQIQIDGFYLDECCEIGSRLTLVNEDGGEETYTVSGILDDYDAGKTVEGSTFAACFYHNGYCGGDSAFLYLRVDHRHLYENIVKAAAQLGLGESDIGLSGTIQGQNARVLINGQILQYDFRAMVQMNNGFGGFLVFMAALVFLTAVLFLASRNLIMLKQNRKELAFYKMQGFSNGQLAGLLWMENMIPGTAGILAGEALSIYVQKLLLYLVQQLRVYSLDSLEIKAPGYLLAGTAGVLFLTLAFLEVLPAFVIRKVSPAEAVCDTLPRQRKRQRKCRRGAGERLPVSLWLGLRFASRERLREGVTAAIVTVTAGMLFLLLLLGRNAAVDFSEDDFQYTITSIENEHLLDDGYLDRLLVDADEIYGLVLAQADILAEGVGSRREWLHTEYIGDVEEGYEEVFFPNGTQIRLSMEGIDRDYYEKYVKAEILGEAPDYDTLVSENGCILYDDFWHETEDGVQCDSLLYGEAGEQIYYGSAVNLETGEETAAGSYKMLARAARKWIENEPLSWNQVNVFLVMPKENLIGRFGSVNLAYVHMNTSLEKAHALGTWLENNASQYQFMVTDRVKELLEQRDKNVITLAGMAFVAFLLLVTSGICIRQTITVGIMERREDIKILQKTGMSGQTTVSMLLAEDVWYALLATVCGASWSAVVLRLPYMSQIPGGWSVFYRMLASLAVFLVIFVNAVFSSRNGMKQSGI